MKKHLFLFILMLLPMLARTQETQNYFPEGTKWTEIRLDTLKYDSWYSKVGDEWVPNFETIEYYVQGEYVEKRMMDYNRFKKVYTNGPEWSDSLTFLIQEVGDWVTAGVLVNVYGEEPFIWTGEAYQFDWSVGKGLYFTDISSANLTSIVQYYQYYGIIDEIKEGYFGGIRPLKYVDLDGKAPDDQGVRKNFDTNGGRIIHGIGITEWNDDKCLFGPTIPYSEVQYNFDYDSHYRSMLVHFERDGEVLYDVWPKKEVAYHPFLKEGKIWYCHESYDNGWTGERWKKNVSYVINGTTEIDGKAYYMMYRKSEDENTYYCALREEGKKVWLYTTEEGDHLLYDFGMSVGDTYKPSYEPLYYQLTDIKPMRFQYDQLLNVFYYDVSAQYDLTEPVSFTTPIVEGVGCENGWNIMEFPTQHAFDFEHEVTFLSCCEGDKCIFTAGDFHNLTATKPDDIAYRPMIENGKVWKFGDLWGGNPAQMIYYFYFDGDTIIDGKTCKQMMCQRIVNPDYSELWAPTSSLSKMGAWYEEDKKVFFYDESTQSMRIMYDFSLNANDTLYFINDSYPDYRTSRTFIIGPKQTGGIKGFKGVYRDIMMCQDEGPNWQSTFWLEGVGGINGLTENAFDPTFLDVGPILMSCTVGDEVIYLNDEIEDGTMPEGARKNRFDFTHTIKTKPKAPRRSERLLAGASSETQSLYGEYNDLQLGINLNPLDDAYLVSITNDSGKAVYEKTVNAGNIVALSIDISAYAKGRYTVTVENSQESFTGHFEVQTTGIQELKNSRIEKLKSIYNLQGQRLSSLQKGLNIVNGQKVYVK